MVKINRRTHIKFDPVDDWTRDNPDNNNWGLDEDKFFDDEENESAGYENSYFAPRPGDISSDSGSAYSQEEFSIYARQVHKFALSRKARGLDTHSAWIDHTIEKKNNEHHSGTIEAIQKILPDEKFVVYNTWRTMYCWMESENLLIRLGVYDSYCHIVAVGDLQKIKAIQVLNDWKERPKIIWRFIADNTVNEHTFSFEFDQKVFPEHYPFINNLDEFISGFLKSRANLLLLMGEPGTGKSTFIKYLINNYNRKVVLTHDETLLSTDGFLVDFITSDENLLIIEDADVLLKSREFAGNKIMAKLLNVSDGILDLAGGKKIIFTTNLTQTNQVDEALLRPGRCYDIVDFRRLNLEEANKVCELHSLPLLTEDREYTLAEIFNKKQIPVKKDRVGFGRFGF